ncbi:MAG TPA: DEAD/DEAH box helicase [Gemmatimonadaceae bacterium]|nr:DEAD/DEAH box helicase [Gemmatimonadaceae bacterium]
MDASLIGAVRVVHGDDARAAIAALLLSGGDELPSPGGVTLWPRQRIAIARVVRSLDEFGGALLADDVGSGKTFVALAVARRHARPVVVAPASLRDAWLRAMARTGMSLPFVSIESLSRSQPRCLEADLDLVIVDEAHHARNPATRRYAALSRLTANARVILLTATPIHNDEHDLLALLALFLGARAHALDSATLARCVVRTTGDPTSGVPRIDGPSPLPFDYDDGAIAEYIASLPPAVPPSDGGVAHALMTLGLLRRWSSSDGALRASLRRRIADGKALADALSTGRHLSRHDLALWTLSDDAQQLALPGLLASPATASEIQPGLREHLARHVEALQRILRHCRERPSPDPARAAALLSLLRAQRGEKVLAFTQFAETASAYWSLLRHVPGAAMLTARGAVVAGGRIPRDDALRRFAPRAFGAAPAHAANTIDCLVTTDIVSEGLDLQDASVVVHLDDPWTPARLEQRVGRAARPGSLHERVLVRTMPAPARGEELLRMRERLHAKLAAARTSLGDVMTSALGAPRTGGATAAAPAAAAIAMQAVAGWRRPVVTAEYPVVAAVRAAVPGWLAAVERDGSITLVGCVGGTIGEDPELIARASGLATGGDVEAGCAASSALVAIADWVAADDAARLAGARDAGIAAGRRMLARAASSVATLPRSRRLVLAGSADAIRAAVGGIAGVGRERELAHATAGGLKDLHAISPLPAPRDFRPGRLLGAVIFVTDG